MNALNRKLLRDLWNLRGQVLAIALVVASGIATYITAIATLDSLELTREKYYAMQRFADVFASVVRAPDHVGQRLREIPGVDVVETRVVAPLSLEVEGFSDPIKGQVISVPAGRQPSLNALYLRAGRLVEPSRANEVVIAYGFAEAHQLETGDSVVAVINGRRQSLRIVGIADSPEFIYVIPPGTLFPDFARWGILWMEERALEATFDMEGAFNDATIRTSRGASVPDVIDAVDLVLARWGGTGAIGRKDQLSHRFLDEEFEQLRTMAAVFPVIFLGVGAFLLNIVMARLIGTQREQIAILKAFGYRHRDLGVHFALMAGAILGVGTVGGIAIGSWLGQGMTRMYVEFFQLPILAFRLRPDVLAQAIAVAAIAVGIGALQGVRSAVRLVPAEAMRPPAPASFQASVFEKLPGTGRLSQGARMILRNLTARPLRTLLSITGVALSCAILMLGRFQTDSIDHMVSAQFSLGQREDLTAGLTENTAARAVFEVAAVPGVIAAEGYRNVPVILRRGHREYRTGIRAYPQEAFLRRVLDADLAPQPIPERGLLLTNYLARFLQVQPGESVEVEVLTGRRQRLSMPVAGVALEYLGLSAHAARDYLAAALGEGDVINEIGLLVDDDEMDRVIDRLAERPQIAGLSRIDRALQAFYDTMAETLYIFTAIFTLLAGSIAFGVIFNNARIALSERVRELASLRILGYRRREIGHILVAELAVITLLAIPLGFLFGYALCGLLAINLESDLYRIPLVVGAGTYGFAGVVVIVAASVSAAFVYKRLSKLDLIETLKIRE